MKVLYHHRTRGVAVEGVHIRSIASALRGLGHQVDIMSLPGADPEVEGPSEHPNQVSKRGFTSWLIGVIARRAPELLFELMELSYNVLALYRLFRYVTVRKPDAIYERYALFMFITVWLARRKGIPIVLEVNDSARLDRVRPLLLCGLAMRIEGWIFRNCSGLVFISSYFHNAAKSAYGDIAPSVVSPNAADVTIFMPNARTRLDVRVALGLQGRVVCGFVGAFLPWHGINIFVEKISAELKQHPQLVLLLVGDGPLFDATRALVDERKLQSQVVFTGRVSHKRVAEFISAMDFAILPDSNDYGSPMKLFEHMAMGVPMVCPGYSPIIDVVADGATGWIFPPKDFDSAVRMTIGLSSEPDEIKRVGEAARAHIVQHRQWTHNAKDLLQLFRSVGANC